VAVNHQQAFVRLKFYCVLGNGENVGEYQDKAGKPGTVSVQTHHVVPLKFPKKHHYSITGPLQPERLVELM
jgi:hypothetical protein